METGYGSRSAYSVKAFSPRLVYTDPFTTNGQLGDNWLKVVTDNRNTANGIYAYGSISGNKLEINANGAAASGFNAAFWIPRQLIFTHPITGAPAGVWGQSQYAQMAFHGFDSTNGGVRDGVCIFNVVGDGTDVAQRQVSYSLVAHAALGNVWTATELFENTGDGNEAGSTGSLLFSDATVLNAGDVLRLEGVVSGSSIIVTVKKNGTQLFQATRALATSGLVLKGMPAMLALSRTNVNVLTRWNNFSGGVL
jgi:hypothetical protein